MPRALPLPVRQTLWQRFRQGQSAAALADALQIPARTVRHLLRRFRLRPETLAPSYRAGPRPDPPRLADALDYRRRHPGWGAELIRLHLRRDRPDVPAPGTRTLQRWFARRGLTPAPPGRPARPRRPRAAAAHAVWEMDAAERIPLGGGGQACWLRLVDECSGAFLHTRVFPPGAVGRGGRRRRARAAARRLHALGTARAAARR